MTNRKNRSISNEAELYREVSDHLTQFSNHLMLVLIAAIAFAASMATDVSSYYAQGSFIIAVILAFVSIIFGHESIIEKINCYIKVDSDYNPLPEDQKFDHTLILRMKKNIECQYKFTLGSLAFIGISILVAIIDK